MFICIYVKNKIFCSIKTELIYGYSCSTITFIYNDDFVWILFFCDGALFKNCLKLMNLYKVSIILYASNARRN